MLGYFLLDSTSNRVVFACRMHAYYKYPDGSEYSGDWSEQGQRHGSGEMKFPDGTRYKGRFENGLCAGHGVMYFADGSRYDMTPVDVQ